MKEQCRVLSCGNPQATRGVCKRCFMRATQGKDGKPGVAEARAAILPSSRGKRKKKAVVRQAEPDASPPEDSPDKADRAAKIVALRDTRKTAKASQRAAITDEINAKIAAITEFATAIGAEVIRVGDGWLYKHFKTYGLFLHLDDEGHLREARLDLTEPLDTV